MSRAGFYTFCVCGRGSFSPTLGGAEAWKDWHLNVSTSGCDHVVSVEYRDARIRPPRPLPAKPHGRRQRVTRRDPPYTSPA